MLCCVGVERDSISDLSGEAARLGAMNDSDTNNDNVLRTRSNSDMCDLRAGINEHVKT